MLTKTYFHLLTGLLLTILVVFLACSRAEHENQTQESAYNAKAGSQTEMAAQVVRKNSIKIRRTL